MAAERTGIKQQLGWLDIVVALILLGILLFASWMQFPAFRGDGSADPDTSSSVQP